MNKLPVPFPDFQSCARCLDNKTLGRARFLGLHILESLLFYRMIDPVYLNIWRQWFNHEYALTSYIFELCNEWILRGNIDTVRARVSDLLQIVDFSLPPDPKWLSDDNFLLSEQQTLLEYDRTWYIQFFKEPMLNKNLASGGGK